MSIIPWFPSFSGSREENQDMSGNALRPVGYPILAKLGRGEQGCDSTAARAEIVPQPCSHLGTMDPKHQTSKTKISYPILSRPVLSTLLWKTLPVAKSQFNYGCHTYTHGSFWLVVVEFSSWFLFLTPALKKYSLQCWAKAKSQHQPTQLCLKTSSFTCFYFASPIFFSSPTDTTVTE